MAKRTSKPGELPDALREAVERTVDATLGSAGRSRDAAQGALDDFAGSVEELRRGAGERIAQSRRSVAEAIEGRRIATQDDLKELSTELRAIGRRLDAIEKRLAERPAARRKSTAAKKSSAAKKPAAAKKSTPRKKPGARSS